ncbi:MAG: hypothetical protein RLZZ232_1856, partial [Planctomycetota bacterium]
PNGRHIQGALKAEPRRDHWHSRAVGHDCPRYKKVPKNLPRLSRKNQKNGDWRGGLSCVFSGSQSLPESPPWNHKGHKKHGFALPWLWLSRFFYGLVADQSENLPKTTGEGLRAIRRFHRLIHDHREKHCQSSENLEDFWWNRHL